MAALASTTQGSSPALNCVVEHVDLTEQPCTGPLPLQFG